MIYRILRYVIAILVGTAAYVGMDSLATIIDPYFDISILRLLGDMSLTVARIAVLIGWYIVRCFYWLFDFIIYFEQGLVIAKSFRARSHLHIPNSRIDCRHHRFIIRS